jgi:hypothetical protein
VSSKNGQIRANTHTSINVLNSPATSVASLARFFGLARLQQSFVLICKQEIQNEDYEKKSVKTYLSSPWLISRPLQRNDDLFWIEKRYRLTSIRIEIEELHFSNICVSSLPTKSVYMPPRASFNGKPLPLFVENETIVRSASGMFVALGAR